MTDQVITIRPTGLLYNGKAGYGEAYGATGGAIPAILADNNDSTGATAAGPGLPAAMALLYSAPPGLPAGARVTGVRSRCRAFEPGDADHIESYIGDSATASDGILLQYWNDTFYLSPGSSVNFNGIAWPRDPSTNADWQTAAVGRLLQALYTYPTTTPVDVSIQEAYIDVLYRRAGSVTVTPFPSAKASTVKPTVSWTTTAPDAPTPQQAAVVYVFPPSVYTASGFDPTTHGGSGALYDSGLIADGAARSHVVQTALPQGQTLRAYVLVQQPWGGTNTQEWWSAGFTEFTVVSEKLSVPSVKALADDIDASVALNLLGAFNLMDQWGSGFEVNPGADWELGDGAALANAPTPGFATTPDGWTVIAAGTGAMRVTRGPFVFSPAGVAENLAVHPSAARTCSLRMRWYDANGAFMREDAAASVACPAGVNTTLSTAFAPAPAGAATGTVVFQADNAVAGDSYGLFGLAPNYYSSWAPVAGVASLCGITPVKFGVPARFGDHAMSLATATSGLCTIQTFFPIAITSGVAYTMNASVATPPAYSARPVQCFIFFYNASSVVVGSAASAVVTEVPGAWVDLVATAVAPATAVTALMSVAVTAASASELHMIDGVSLHPNLVGGYGAGGWATAGFGGTFGYEVQRSLDGGVTWTDVRMTSITIDPKVQNNVLRDNEVPLGRVALYRVRASAHSTSLGDATSDWSATSTTVVAATSARLKCPNQPSLNMPIRLMAPFSPSRKFSLGVFDNILGRKEPVLITDGQKGWEGSAKFRLIGQDEHDAFEAILDSGEILLLQDTVGRQWYCRPKAITEDEIRGVDGAVNSPYPIGKITDVDLSFVSTSSPT